MNKNFISRKIYKVFIRNKLKLAKISLISLSFSLFIMFIIGYIPVINFIVIGTILYFTLDLSK